MRTYYENVKYYADCENGSVYLISDGERYAVVGEFLRFNQFGEEIGGVNKFRPCANWDAAYKLYNEYWKQLHGIFPPKKVAEPKRKCAFNCAGNMCRRKNCPAELGGAAYWEIFRGACLYRKR